MLGGGGGRQSPAGMGQGPSGGPLVLSDAISSQTVETEKMVQQFAGW